MNWVASATCPYAVVVCARMWGWSFADKGGLEVVDELEGEEQELEQVEMLLETYFMQLDQLHERLLDMKENIEAAAVCHLLALSAAHGNAIDCVQYVLVDCLFPCSNEFFHQEDLLCRAGMFKVSACF